MSNAAGLVREVPEKPIPLAEVIERWPVLRQSDLSTFDDCELGAYFKIKYENGWSGSPQARGTIEHRVIAACLREMIRTDSEFIPADVAEMILIEKLRQHGVPPEDRVRVPLREIRDMRWTIRKWARDSSFNIRSIHEDLIEKRLEGVLSYRDPATGELIERRVSGQLDLMIARGDDEMIVCDWKGGWHAPVKREEDNNEDGAGLSYGGYFQQRFYGVLGMQNFRSLMAVVLREFYQRLSAARPARITRQNLPKAEEELSLVVEAFDLALASGKPPALRIDALNAHGHWKPSPGAHCRWCPGRRFCPIDDEVTVGGIATQGDAERIAGARKVAREIDKAVKPHLERWVELYGPIPLKYAKGRRVLGFRNIAGGKQRFEDFTPSETDRPPTQDTGPVLLEAMRESVEEARKERTG